MGCGNSKSAQTGDAPRKDGKVHIAIVFYSMYGHIEELAKAIEEGLKKVKNVEVKIFRAKETLDDDVLEKMHAPKKSDKYPEAAAETVAAYDGILFGSPTRYGTMAAQEKAFWDSTGSLWQSGSLHGKPAGLFFSTGTQGGGQETTAWTTLTQLTHHGMLYVPMGYTNSEMFNNEDVRGGSPYGPGTFAGADGARTPSKAELELCRGYGQQFANTAKALATGKK
eukprot:gb/GECG01013017.1/.p1 GENE.gb/GECG01013017.1/~~gb/GECG01013017.1/.p1  ORF type:complete len:224 (+),score=32.95 gb/GECG01013017.1/:1-672(+)